MSPIHDSRFAAGRDKYREQELRDKRHADQVEYLRPLMILGAGLAVVLTMIFMEARPLPDDPPAAIVALFYLISLAVQLVIGVAGLWIAANLWLGGVGYLGLSILRLAACYAASDAVFNLLINVPIFNWGVSMIVYLGLLMWLFELDFQEAVILAIITWLLKLVVGFAIAAILMSAL